MAQSRVIRRIAAEGSYVIVGRCADYILRDYPHCIRIFLHADMPYKTEHAIKEYGLNPATAATEIDRINRARSMHYYHFTGRRWDDMRNYQLACNTGAMDNEQICTMIESLYRQQRDRG